MQFSTKADYGLRAMLDIALHSGEGPVPLRDIAGRQDISSSYLEQLLLSLQAVGLLRSTRGRKGGFSLTKSPSEITLEIVLRSLERRLSFADCVDHPDICPRQKQCVTNEVWCRLTDVLLRELKTIKLSDLIKSHLLKNPGEDLPGFNNLPE